MPVPEILFGGTNLYNLYRKPDREISIVYYGIICVIIWTDLENCWL